MLVYATRNALTSIHATRTRNITAKNEKCGSAKGRYWSLLKSIFGDDHGRNAMSTGQRCRPRSGSDHKKAGLELYAILLGFTGFGIPVSRLPQCEWWPSHRRSEMRLYTYTYWEPDGYAPHGKFRPAHCVLH